MNSGGQGLERRQRRGRKAGRLQEPAAENDPPPRREEIFYWSLPMLADVCKVWPNVDDLFIRCCVDILMFVIIHILSSELDVELSGPNKSPTTNRYFCIVVTNFSWS